jgi:hypothetical protein
MQAGRLRSGAAGLVLSLGLVCLTACHGTYVAPRPSAPAAVIDEAGAQQALATLADDVRRGARAGGGLAPTLAANAAALHVAGFTARYVSPDSAAAPDGSWTADVDLTWRFAGFDARDVEETVAVTFAPQGGGAVAIRSVGGQGHRTPLWLTGPLQVRRGAGYLVLVSGTAEHADDYARLAQRAIAAVRRVVPWPQPDLVLEVPASETALEDDLAATPQSYAGVAAVTATVDGSGTAGTPVHVFVNPDAIGNLHGQGAQVVLSHEATHDATGAVPNSTLPKWLLEGFADYVALRDVHLPLSVTARELLADVRKHGAPAHLPTDADFNAEAEDFGEEYEQAWTVCRTLADAGGEAALVRLYDAVRDGAPLEATMVRDFGFGAAGLTTRWQQWLTRVAR